MSAAERGAVERVVLDAAPWRLSGLAAGPEDGELVVALHGFPQTSAAWTSQLAALGAAGYRAVAPDQRGYAAGARPQEVGQYRLDRLVADVLAVADGLGRRRFSVVGHDWGGVLAWALGADHADRVASVAVVSTPHPRALAASLWRSAQGLRSAYVGFFQLPRLPEAALLAGGGAPLRAVLRGSGLSAERADAYARALAEPGAITGALNWYRANGASVLRAVGRVAVPTLYVWGSGDPALGRTAAEATGRHADGPYRFAVLEGAGHWVPEERADELNRLLLEHLAPRR